MYKVKISFVDLQDNQHRYEEGDDFPREGVSVSKHRISELASDKNKRHMPLIELVEEPNKNEEAAEESAEKKETKKPATKKATTKSKK